MLKKQLLLALVFVTGLGGQTTIIGSVHDAQNGTLLPGANVILTGGNLTVPSGAATDGDGNYRIPNIRPGSYQLRVGFIGYRLLEQSVTITDATGPRLEVHMQLDQEAIQLQSIGVTASRGKREKITDTPAAVIIISSVQISRGSNPNLGDYFKHIKGVDFTASGIDGFNLSARGFNTSFSSRLLTLTDGRKANVPSLRLIAYNTIPTTSDDVDQIEVVLGPSSALYGPNAFSGVANIITKKPSLSQGTTMTMSLGNRDYRKWQVRHAGAQGKWGYKISLVDFSATDWEWVDPEEKWGHHEYFIAGGDPNDLPYPWIWDGYDLRFDRDGNGRFHDPVDSVSLAIDHIRTDRNKDGIPDLPDFRVENQRADVRVDYDFGPDHSLIYGYGLARATNINLTGIARFLADQWIYQYHHLRYMRNNLFIQTYLNTSDAGLTRNLRTGDRIFDKSTFYHLQLQHTLMFPSLLGTQVSYGFDYQRTMPKTFGTILPDGTGGKQPESYDDDGIDNDGDGKIDEFGEGLITTNEYGFYFQSTSNLTATLELILASRIDLHNGVQDTVSGLTFLDDPLLGGTLSYAPQFSPKVGFLWKPGENQTFRLTAARAFNTPTSQGLYLDLLAGLSSATFVKARGNADGYHYTRNAGNNLMMIDVRPLSPTEFYLAEVPAEAVLIIPAVLGRPAQFVQAEDILNLDAVVSEEIFTVEAGYVGILGNRMRVTLDLYNSWYKDFVSDLTWITPVVLDTSDGLENFTVLGIIGTEEHNGVLPGPDGIEGTPDDQRDFVNPREFILTNVNYGSVTVGGVDFSLAYFFSRNLSGEMRLSYLGKQAFDNPLTKAKDPINAPAYKLSASLSYTSPSGRWWSNLSIRHIPGFDWSAGVFFGTIDTYTVADINLGHRINDTYTLKANLNNITNDVHREIVGGAELGRQIVLSMSMNL